MITRLDLARISSTLYYSATSLSHDKYEKKENDSATYSRPEERSDVTVQSRRSVLYSQKKKKRV